MTYLLAIRLSILSLAVPSLLAAEPPITSLVLSPDGESLIACSQAGLHVYHWPHLEAPTMSIETELVNIHDAAFSQAGDLLAVAGGAPAQSGNVEIYSWPAVERQHTLQQHQDSVLATAWLNADTLASASLDRQILFWRLGESSPARELQGHSRGISSLCFLTDGQHLVSCGIDQNLRVWDVPSGKLIRSLNNHTRSVHRVALRPANDGLPMVASASDDRTVRFWQPTIGRMVRFIRLQAVPLDLHWLPDGQAVVATCNDGRLRWIDPETAEVTRDVQAFDGWCYSLAIHPTDGSLVVGGRNGKIKRVDNASSRPSAPGR